MSGHIETVPARELRVGDMLSTDGGVVTWVCELSGGGAPAEISVTWVCHGVEKQEYLAPEFPVHLWRRDDSIGG